MTDLTETIDTHLAAYCDPDPRRRSEAVVRVWVPEGQLIDPPLDATDRDGIEALADAVLEHFPSHTFQRVTAVDEHHGFARYGWELRAPDGTPTVTGTDFAEVDDAGRLVRIVGFFGELAPAA